MMNSEGWQEEEPSLDTVSFCIAARSLVCQRHTKECGDLGLSADATRTLGVVALIVTVAGYRPYRFRLLVNIINMHTERHIMLCNSDEL